MKELDSNTIIPNHIGIIPDGNRRWAKAQGVSSFEGHKAGADIIETICGAALDRGVKYLTLYAFSTENWARTQDEIGYLMKLFENLVNHNLKKLEAKGIRVFWIGREQGLTHSLIKAIKSAEERTAGNTKGVFSICLNYGGLQELADAASALNGASTGVTPDLLMERLYVPEVPPVDLVIRTSGEQRTSGFMLARAAYAELYFVEKHWPDFTVTDLNEAIDEYSHRKRNFGA